MKFLVLVIIIAACCYISISFYSSYKAQKGNIDYVDSQMRNQLLNLEHEARKHKLEMELGILQKEINDLEINRIKQKNEFEEEQYKLAEIKDRIDVAINTEHKILELKRQEKENENKSNKDFFKLQLSSIAIDDIKVLKSISHLISNKTEFNKFVWKFGYEKSFNELCGRILDTNANCGIYKITNLDNEKVYIGQSVNLKDRLRSHIKSGLGTDNKDSLLYQEMRETDLTNFTFEIVEYCKREELDSQERLWIEYYQSNIFGYNGNKGVGSIEN